MPSKNRLTRRVFLQRSALGLGGILAWPIARNFSPALQAVAGKRIYIAADDHTDYMWAGDEETYRQAFLRMLDYYLDLTDTTADHPADYQSRWNCDGSFWLWTYEKNRPPAAFQRLIARLRDGHISAPMTPLVQTLGGAPAEAVLRGMYYPGQLERRYNLRFVMAAAMENQTLPYGLGALWAGAGAKYSWRGICGCASKVADAWDRPHDIYWWVGPDGSRILMKWNSMLAGNQSMGGYAEARNPGEVVDYVDSDGAFQKRYPYSVIGCFGKGWDDLQTLTDEFVTVAQGKSNATRRVIVSNEQDFFEDFESTYGAGLPTQACSFGNEWDLYSASLAEVSARVKRAVEKLRTAEALATLVSMQDTGFLVGRQQARDQAWMDLGLYWEHNWTADGNVVSRQQRADWQRRLAGEIETYVDALAADAGEALGRLIQKRGTALRFYVFNALSWQRTDYADFAYGDPAPCHVVDLATGQETPSQIVMVDGQRRLRVLAVNVPAVGYKVYEVRTGAEQSYGPAATVSGGVIEHARYRVTVAERGAITSLVDKGRGNREFAQEVGGRSVNDLGAGVGTLAVENAGPVTVTLVATASGPLEHTTRVTLIRDVDRVEIRNDITQNFDGVNSWGFGFQIANPDVWHEEVGAVIRARLVEQGGHYSAHQARYDWLTLNHFADMSGGGVGVTLSNADCYFMQLGNSTANVLDSSVPQIAVLAGGQVDGPTLGIPGQGGDAHFLQRFALQTHDAYNPVSAMRFALEHQNPLWSAAVIGGDAYPEATYSFLTISDPNVLLWALKPADDGALTGIITRLWNLSPDPKEFVLALSAGPIQGAHRTTHIETPIGDATTTNGALVESIKGQQMATFSAHLIVPSSSMYLPLITK